MAKTAKNLIKIASISLVLVSSAFAEDAKSDLQYMERNKDGWFIFHTLNPASSVFDTNLFFNGIDSLATWKSLKWWFLDIKNIDRDWGKLSIETKTSVVNKLWITEFTSVVSNTLSFRNPDDTYFIKNWEIQYKNFNANVILKLNKDISKSVNLGILWLREYKLDINWTELPLSPDDWVRSDATKCYATSEWIQCASGLFPLSDNFIRLKIDWFYSNGIYLNKEAYSFEKPIKTELEDVSGTKFIKFTFNKPKNIQNLNNVDAFVNWSKIPTSDYSLWASLVSVRYDLINLTKDDKFLKVVFRNNSDNTYSVPMFLNVESQVWMNIKNVKVTRAWSSELTLECTWDLDWMIGNNYKFKINMNGEDYFLDGTQEKVMENGKEVIDKYWHTVYVTKNKLSFIRRTNTSLIFWFDENQLLKWENVFYVKNENTLRESNKVSFTRWSYNSMNYLYSTWTVATAYDESMIFENWKEIVQRKLDFVNQKDTWVLPLWKLNISNLKDYNVYRLSFDISSNAPVNPFSQLKIGNTDLQIKNSAGWIWYRFEMTWIWKDMKSWELVWAVNELFNVSPSTVNLKLMNFSIEKMDNKNAWTKIYASNAFSEINFSYIYDFWNCFDWDKDYCGLNWLRDPSLVINLLFWKNQPDTSASIQPVAASAVIANDKANVEILELNFSSEKYRTTNAKLKRLYELIIAKWLTSRQKTTLKNSINSIIRALKDVEDNKSKAVAAKQIKEGVSNINWILRSLKK
ncbi:MAG: hypothetical protein ACD_2C00264G0013 [uncultured bacterium (gcode 4)]|uniref:Uncharacterized protein n=1 Tax=uncultured bacterium (gcode 4) TaxID=1234023 RepID=K2G120_9BACT|nr:MAG: hypothetical protein ACD_2C00264G0013 [uncultured bacterium (gcode 4)]